MSREPGKDILKNPTPTAGAEKYTVDTVLRLLNFGNSMVSLLAGLLAAVLILYSGYVLYDNFSTEYRAYSSAWDLLRYKPVTMQAGEPIQGTAALEAINQDYRAWLTVYDTTIDYPVLQGPNDLYYANHDIYGNTSLTGAIYLAAGNSGSFSDNYNIIYGHHMDNGAMFGALDKFKDEGYFRTHQTATVVSKSGIYDITFFAVATTDAYESRIYTPGDRAKEVLSFLQGDRSKDVGVGTNILIWDANAARGAQKVIALSTCADAETNGRLVIFGRMVWRNDSTVQAETTEEPEEIKKVKLTVRYLMIDGTEVFPTQVFIYKVGDKYYVVAPPKPGYDVSIRMIRGTIEEDTEIIVVYKPKLNKLKIQYRFMDGTQAAETYEQTIRTGDTYDIKSPEVKGYIAVRVRVKGTNPGRDEQWTVLYVPDGTVMIPELTTPLYPGVTQMQMGVCFE